MEWLLPDLPADPKVIEILYSKHLLKRIEIVSGGAPYTGDWLRDCLQRSHAKWQQYL